MTKIAADKWLTSHASIVMMHIAQWQQHDGGEDPGVAAGPEGR
ncbi:hypothetical protein [Nocardia sp. NBC_01009]|nr:hypothetical protein OHA42_32280 [Nocardia sp. NBC_01009]